MKTLLCKLCGLYQKMCGGLDWLAPFFQLAARFIVAKAFFMSGLSKIKSFESTIWLFQDEYKVPLLPPVCAAYIGTGAELILPPLLLLGLGGRFAAIALFIFNAVAVISYPDIGYAGINQHYYWGALIAIIIFFGPGKWSVDHYFCKNRSLRSQG